MGTFSIWHWLVLLAVVMLLFGGRGKISSVMGDVAHGIRNFREGLKDPQEQASLSDSKPEAAAEAQKSDEVKS
ncbi:MAG: twin-arginine translocase TatA/TatE family subunit [Proteobacteria bacterium]|nr:twin-arginine translocase TatA/TatE family subunit [Pseudomonadota bacterium]